MRAIHTAMVLAAGRGERMRPLTDRIPKPLVRIAGRSMLDRMLDALERFGVSLAVVNASHLGWQVERLLERRTRPPVHVSLEDERLETGGGVRRALPHLGHGAFLVANADIVLPRAEHAFRSLEQHWDGRVMDALLLVMPRDRATGYSGPGDFDLPLLPKGRSSASTNGIRPTALRIHGHSDPVENSVRKRSGRSFFPGCPVPPCPPRATPVRNRAPR